MQTIKNIIWSLRMTFSVNYLLTVKRLFIDFSVRFIYRTYNVFLSVFFLGYVLKCVENTENLLRVGIFVGCSIILMMLYDYIAAWFYNKYKPIVDAQVKCYYESKVMKHAAQLDIACFDNPYFYNKYFKVAQEICPRLENVLSDILELIVDLIMLVYISTSICKIDNVILICLLIPLLIKVVSGRKLNDEKYQLYQANIEAYRERDYIKRTMYSQDFSKEIHSSNIFKVILRKIDSESDTIIKNIRKRGKKIALLDFVNSSMIDGVVYFSLLIYVAYKVIALRALTISDAIILMNSITKIGNALPVFVNRLLKFNEHSVHIEDIRSFFCTRSSLKAGSRKIDANTRFDLRLHDVSFEYEKNQTVLKEINLEISYGEKVAIVGLNGAGKSTLIKLLLRLYDPTEGVIMLNGVDIKEYCLDDYRSIFSTVFQDYKIYATGVYENVAMGDELDHNSIVNSLIKVGIYDKIKSQTKNIAQAKMTKHFDKEGLVLSGGENQKLAISRVFNKRSGIAILDEPSSALDPIAEKEIFDMMFESCSNKTLIFICHRISLAALADKIVVMKEGKIAEVGTHSELIELGGQYSEMVKKQMTRFGEGDEGS